MWLLNAVTALYQDRAAQLSVCNMRGLLLTSPLGLSRGVLCQSPCGAWSSISSFAALLRASARDGCRVTALADDMCFARTNMLRGFSGLPDACETARVALCDIQGPLTPSAARCLASWIPMAPSSCGNCWYDRTGRREHYITCEGQC